MSKEKSKLNNQLVRPNPDKKNREKWADGRNMMNIPKPYSMIINGLPSCGKTNSVLDLLIKADKPFHNIFLSHPVCFNYKVPPADEMKNANIIEEKCEIPEYEGVDFIALKYLPSESFFEKYKDKRNIYIIDDIDVQQAVAYSNIKKQRLDKLMTFCVSHYNVCVVVCCQDVQHQLMPIMTRAANVFCLYKLRDRNSISAMSKSLGLSCPTLKYLYSLCDDLHDCVQIDFTEKSPFKFRKNWYELIDPIIDFLKPGRSKAEKKDNQIIMTQLEETSKPENEEELKEMAKTLAKTVDLKKRDKIESGTEKSDQE